MTRADPNGTSQVRSGPATWIAWTPGFRDIACAPAGAPHGAAAWRTNMTLLVSTGLNRMWTPLAIAAALLLAVPMTVLAQDEAGPPPDTTGTVPADHYANMTSGEFTPARGFDLIRTERGSLNISVYGLFRYLGQ